MKKICWLLIITLLMGCLAACYTTEKEQADQAVEKLSQAKKDEISQSFYALGGDRIELWYDEGYVGGARYYGSENGYDILFIHSPFCIPGSATIAGYEFVSFQQFYLHAYKDGEFRELDSVYEDGLISDKAIEKAHMIHQKIEDEIAQQREEDFK